MLTHVAVPPHSLSLSLSLSYSPSFLSPPVCVHGVLLCVVEPVLDPGRILLLLESAGLPLWLRVLALLAPRALGSGAGTHPSFQAELAPDGGNAPMASCLPPLPYTREGAGAFPMP